MINAMVITVPRICPKLSGFAKEQSFEKGLSPGGHGEIAVPAPEPGDVVGVAAWANAVAAKNSGVVNPEIIPIVFFIRLYSIVNRF